MASGNRYGILMKWNTLIIKFFNFILQLVPDILQDPLLYLQYDHRTNPFRWRRGPDCPKKRVEAQGCILNKQFYLFGGYESIDQVLSRCDVFDFKTNEWIAYFDVPYFIPETHIAVIDDRSRHIYFLGGQKGSHCAPCTNGCYAYDIRTKNWTKLPSLPQKRYLSTGLLWKDRLHVVGGSGEDRFSPMRDHWSIKVQDGRALEERWRDEIPIPRGGIHSGHCLVGDSLYVIGGSEGDVRPISGDPQYRCDWEGIGENVHGEMFRLEYESEQWEKMPSMPVPLSHIETSIVVVKMKILVLGGIESRTKCSRHIWCFDTVREKWSNIGSLPYDLKSKVSILHDGSIYLFAGQRVEHRLNLSPARISSKVWMAALPDFI